MSATRQALHPLNLTSQVFWIAQTIQRKIFSGDFSFLCFNFLRFVGFLSFSLNQLMSEENLQICKLTFKYVNLNYENTQKEEKGV